MTKTNEAREAIIRCLSESLGWSKPGVEPIADRIVALPEISGPLAEAGMAASDREQFPDDG